MRNDGVQFLRAGRVVKHTVKTRAKYFDVGRSFCVYIYKGRDHEK